MASNLNRWMNYARARIETAVGKGNQELDRLEAERETELADRPWLGADADAPTLDEARARIRWEAERAAAGAEGGAALPTGDPTAGPTPADSAGADSPPPSPRSPDTATPTAARGEAEHVADAGPSGGTTPAATPTATPIRSPEEVQAEFEAAGARLELEARQRESAARLDAIREELGIEPPPVSGPREPKAN